MNCELTCAKVAVCVYASAGWNVEVAGPFVSVMATSSLSGNVAAYCPVAPAQLPVSVPLTAPAASSVVNVMDCEPGGLATVVAFVAITTWSVGSNGDRKSTRLNSSHTVISYAVFCLNKKTRHTIHPCSLIPKGN